MTKLFSIKNILWSFSVAANVALVPLASNYVSLLHKNKDLQTSFDQSREEIARNEQSIAAWKAIAEESLSTNREMNDLLEQSQRRYDEMSGKVAKLNEELVKSSEDNLAALVKGNTDLLREIHDKGDAVEQMWAQEDSMENPGETVGFTGLASLHPWMQSLPATIGEAFSYPLVDGAVQRDKDLKYTARGSVVLLDREGTVAMAGHELGANSWLGFKYNLPDGRPVTGVIIGLQYDRQHDLMFGTLKPDVAGSLKKLLPVRWSLSDDVRDKTGPDYVIGVGYAAPSHRLHATAGAVNGFNDAVRLRDDKVTACQISGLLPIFAGMSGGSGFDISGAYEGTLTSGSPVGTHASGDFVPAAFVRAWYVSLYPERARRAGVKAPDTASWPQSCVVTSSFLAVPDFPGKQEPSRAPVKAVVTHGRTM